MSSNHIPHQPFWNTLDAIIKYLIIEEQRTFEKVFEKKLNCLFETLMTSKCQPANAYNNNDHYFVGSQIKQ